MDFNIIVAQYFDHFYYTYPKCIQLGVNCISKGLFQQQQQNDKFITDLGPFTYSCSASGQLLNPPSPLVQPISQEKPFLPYLSISVHGKIVSSDISDMLLNSSSASVAKPKVSGVNNLPGNKTCLYLWKPLYGFLLYLMCCWRGLHFCKS